MAQRRRGSYPPEFRAEAIRLARTTTTPLTTIARDLGVSTFTLRAWVKQADAGGDGSSLKRVSAWSCCACGAKTASCGWSAKS
jgi:transposase-like protein